MLMCASKHGDVDSSNFFVNELQTPTTAAGLEALEEANEHFEIKHYNTDSATTPLSTYQAKYGYQPYEPIKGFVQLSPTAKLQRVNDNINVQRAGVFGECTNAGLLTFMSNVESSSCSFLPQLITQDFCEKTLSIEHILKM